MSSVTTCEVHGVEGCVSCTHVSDTKVETLRAPPPAEKLRAALESVVAYSEHFHSCDLMNGPVRDEPHCKCGLSKAVEIARKALADTEKEDA